MLWVSASAGGAIVGVLGSACRGRLVYALPRSRGCSSVRVLRVGFIGCLAAWCVSVVMSALGVLLDCGGRPNTFTVVLLRVVSLSSV